MTNFSTKPVVGHRVKAETYQPKQIIEGLSTPDERIRITADDVDWDDGKKVTMTTETFEEMIEWYEDQK